MGAEILEFIKVLLGCLLALQGVSIFVFLISEWIMVDFYRLGTFENPESIFDRIPDLCMKFILGMGYYFYNKYRRYNWFIRKLLMLITLIVYSFLAIILYYLITIPMDNIYNILLS